MKKILITLGMKKIHLKKNMISAKTANYMMIANIGAVFENQKSMNNVQLRKNRIKLCEIYI